MEAMRRTQIPRKSSLRKELESYAIAHNKILINVVGEMSPIILLRNIHFDMRAILARKLYDNHIITRVEATEFTTVLPY